jgi:hypothetical protein
MQKEADVNNAANFKKVLSLMPLLLTHSKFIIKIFFIYLGVFVVNLIAVKFYKMKSDYLGLLTCTLFVSVIEILQLSVMIILISYMSVPYSLATETKYIFFPWAIILNIIAIKTIYNTSLRKASEIFFFFFLLIIVFVLIWAAVG